MNQLPIIHLAITHEGNEIVYSSESFQDVLANAPKGTFIVTESWITSGSNRKAELITGINWYYGVYLDAPGQRVDLAIQWLRDHGVKCERYTSRLLRESSYGRLPMGSVVGMVIAVGDA